MHASIRNVCLGALTALSLVAVSSAAPSAEADAQMNTSPQLAVVAHEDALSALAAASGSDEADEDLQVLEPFCLVSYHILWDAFHVFIPEDEKEDGVDRAGLCHSLWNSLRRYRGCTVTKAYCSKSHGGTIWGFRVPKLFCTDDNITHSIWEGTTPHKKVLCQTAADLAIKMIKDTKEHNTIVSARKKAKEEAEKKAKEEAEKQAKEAEEELEKMK